MPMTTEKIAELRAAATRATPGPWRWRGHQLVSLGAAITIHRDGRLWNGTQYDLDHIANCDPTTILALLDEIARRALSPTEGTTK